MFKEELNYIYIWWFLIRPRIHNISACTSVIESFGCIVLSFLFNQLRKYWLMLIKPLQNLEIAIMIRDVQMHSNHTHWHPTLRTNVALNYWHRNCKQKKEKKNIWKEGPYTIDIYIIFIISIYYYQRLQGFYFIIA